MTTTNKPRHSDLNPSFGIPQAKAILYGEEAVQTAVRLFLVSPVGSRSRTFQPLWGCDLLKQLQEPFGDVTAQAIRVLVITSLARFEPRIEILAPYTNVQADIEARAYKVMLVYRLSGIDHVRSYSFALELDQNTES